MSLKGKSDTVSRLEQYSTTLRIIGDSAFKLRFLEVAQVRVCCRALPAPGVAGGLRLLACMVQHTALPLWWGWAVSVLPSRAPLALSVSKLGVESCSVFAGVVLPPHVCVLSQK